MKSNTHIQPQAPKGFLFKKSYWICPKGRKVRRVENDLVSKKDFQREILRTPTIH